ncbi:AAA family ATPase [Candidatus Woesearchaeota archaeon]|nr:AAA family ATPase [Candidatus Woesearchaeota archaeon]
MLLKSIKLESIRSYLNQKIEFPHGACLLSGDIGTGKSTILMAVEFALFGAKSELPASSLLRHGKKEGSVELLFELDGKNITIKRNLKRGKDSIKQETGYMLIDGIKKELSPIEMKSEIFEMLSYPKDLLSKGKDLIYRYTVYTPQEEMKRIILEDRDTRLNIIRKVFNIDKYKKIRENASIFIRALKEKRRELEGFIADLSEKLKELDSIKKEISELDKKITETIPESERAKSEVAGKRKSILLLEAKIAQLSNLKAEFQLCEAELRNSLREHERNNNEIKKLALQINEMLEEIDQKALEKENEFNEKIKIAEAEIKVLEEEMDLIKQKLSESRVNKIKAEEIINKITKIEKCPLCLQNVEHSHKNLIEKREKDNIAGAEIEIKECSGKEKQLKGKIGELRQKIDEMKNLKGKIELARLKIKNADDKQKDMERIQKMQEGIKEKINAANAKKIEVSGKIEEMRNVEESCKNAKNELDAALSEEKKLDIRIATLKKENESLSRIAKSLEDGINKKTAAKKKLEHYSELQNWLENYFVSLMDTIERHVMLRVYTEFNELFKTWFNILIEDETTSVRLDEEFTPVIEQNGYETYIENLSGGEKTSVALSYRLALCKAICDIVSDIKTKDILMLDEPTDGFSSEQLDKVRDILNQLNLKQIIIVSHETKIESFVDKVIKIGKEEHVSVITP